MRLSWQPVLMGCINMNWEQTLDLTMKEAEKIIDFTDERRSAEIKALFSKK